MPSPLRGEGKGGGERPDGYGNNNLRITLIPLTLTLSPKGRGEITFDNSQSKKRRKGWKNGGKIFTG